MHTNQTSARISMFPPKPLFATRRIDMRRFTQRERSARARLAEKAAAETDEEFATMLAQQGRQSTLSKEELETLWNKRYHARLAELKLQS